MKAYFVMDRDEGYGVAVIADSKEEVLEKYRGDIENLFDCELSELDYEIRELDVDEKVINELGKGIVEGETGIHYGIYSWIEDMECPVCHKVTIVYHEEVNGQHIVACEDCMHKLGVW